MSKNKEAVQRIKRERTNILHKSEFATIEFLCRVMPAWVSPDMLSAIGMIGSFIAAASVYFASYDKRFLFLIIPGMAIQWFGDSLDGRIAYYRNTPRKWYGWLLDMNLDWLSIVLISAAYFFYLHEYPIMGFLFMAFYGQAMLLTIMRYKLTDVYLIDADGPLGPTETRILITLATIIEFFVPNFLLGFGVFAITILIIRGMVDFFQLAKIANEKDANERTQKTTSNSAENDN